MKKFAILLYLLGGTFVPYLSAAKHPVPLDPKIDSAACLECHEANAKGKHVHPAVEMGCLTCHFVRQNGEETRIVLKHSRISLLCESCHDDKKVDARKVTLHPPAAEDCLKCHNPHVSDNDHLLLKPTTGATKDDNVCLSCHTQGMNVGKDGSRHAALDMGCSTCHLTHKTGERGKQEFQYHLTKPTPALCLDCHDIKDAELQKAHQGQPLAGADCVQCHNPHQSNSPKLLQANLHNPFENKMCDSCHQPAQNGKVVLTQPDSRQLCLTCHEETAKKIEAAKVAHPGAQGECIACHDPHAGKAARFLKIDGVQACLSCHTDQADMLSKKPALHDPAFNQRCAICHEPHGNDREHLLRTDVDTLCLTCHSGDAKALKSPDGKTESVLGKQIVVPVGYVDRAPKIPIGRPGMLGHPVPMHPTSAPDPREKHKGENLTCVTCHNPHAGDARYLLNSQQGSVRALCGECHQNMRTE